MLQLNEIAPISSLPEPSTPVAPCNPPEEARAARLAKFKREQLIVDYLNRGVSIAEIAARVGVGEKRMRAIVREIVSRRMPAPEEFVAIQVSRLNEALLVAYSAMSTTNFKAVDQVVRIVRALDRYHGVFAGAGRRLPQAPQIEAPAVFEATFGAALFCRAELPLPPHCEERDQVPGNEGVDAGDALGVDGWLRCARHGGTGSDAPKPDPSFAVKCEPDPGERPENPPQGVADVESAPGVGADVTGAFMRPCEERPPDQVRGGEPNPAVAAPFSGRSLRDAREDGEPTATKPDPSRTNPTRPRPAAPGKPRARRCKH